jgi:hypothetical protein
MGKLVRRVLLILGGLLALALIWLGLNTDPEISRLYNIIH